MAALTPLPGLAADTGTPGSFPEIRFSAAQVVLGSRKLSGVDFRLEASGGFTFQSAAFEDSPGGFRHEGVSLDGQLDAFQLPETGLQANGMLRYGPVETDWYLRTGKQGASLCLLTVAQPMEILASLNHLPEQAAWIKAGKVDACIRYRQPDAGPVGVDYDFALTGFSFDSPDGRFAAEGLSLDLNGEIRFDEPLSVSLDGVMTGGEVLLDNFYTNFGQGALQFRLLPEFRENRVAGAKISLRDEAALRLDARLSLPEGRDWQVTVSSLDLYFPGAYQRYFEPLAAAWTLDGLQVTGAVHWNGTLAPGLVDSGDLEIIDLSVVDVSQNRFALTGLAASLRPGDHDFDSRLSWLGLLLGRINLGSGTARLDAEPGAFALLQPLELAVLGGRLRLDRLKYVMPGSPAVAAGESRFEMEASLAEIDMREMTEALGWPLFSGRLSGHIPGARLENGVLEVDGEVRIDVFNGRVSITELGAERLFGVLPSLSANIEMHDLDLEQLTETFEFGRIIGRVDGHVSGLRMLDWRPVAFDAWLGTPERQERSRSISRQAVNNLTSIGGGGATAALTGPILRMFSNFSYRRLGLGCRLQNNVCHVRGVSDDGSSVLLLEGAGVPKITVRAWNRSVDWPQMVANLSAIAEGESVQIGEAPER
ncbi:MAG: hypothetical protein V2I48_09995 [Xanthomonadales bacterium]|nr:hypothetical protein [Xanthomonadales bacterium]